MNPPLPGSLPAALPQTGCVLDREASVPSKAAPLQDSLWLLSPCLKWYILLKPWLLLGQVFSTILSGAPLPTPLQINPPQIIPFWACPFYPVGPWLATTPSFPTSTSVPLPLSPYSLPSSCHPQVIHSLRPWFTPPPRLHVLSKFYPLFQAQLWRSLLLSQSGAWEVLWASGCLNIIWAGSALQKLQGRGIGSRRYWFHN